MAKFSGMNAYLRAGLAVSVSAIALGVVTPAFAQATDSENTDEAGRDIVVTAQFRSQKLQDTPLSITAVDATMLESRNQTDLSQIAAQAPNVTLNAMGGAYGSSLGPRFAASASSTSTPPMSRASACMSTMSIMRR